MIKAFPEIQASLLKKVITLLTSVLSKNKNILFFILLFHFYFFFIFFIQRGYKGFIPFHVKLIKQFIHSFLILIIIKILSLYLVPV
jgi:hypothetical protein